MDTETKSTEAAAGVANMSTPVAIIIAGAMVAAALYFGASAPARTAVNQPPAPKTAPDKMVAVTAADHILGNPDAPVKIIEYTDFECPFCKQFHGTMKTIMDTYGASGQVAWVIRNFPLEQLHPNAPKLALAAECVAEQGGSKAYFAFLDEVFRVSPINTFFDFAKLDATAKVAGVDVTKFETCYKSGKYTDKINTEIQDAIASGGTGTPHNILQDSHGKYTLIAGSQPLDVVKAAIEKGLK
jgi:protein-disulfide isomerase